MLQNSLPQGVFTNYVYERRGVGGQKNRPFVNFYTIENVNEGKEVCNGGVACSLLDGG